jgi:hypothetical protein
MKIESEWIEAGLKAADAPRCIVTRGYVDGDDVRNILSAVAPLIRAAALDEAARVAEENAHEGCEVAEAIAASIRALASNGEKPNG